MRDLAAETGKQVELVVVGAETELDRVILEGLSEPLVHLLRNAVGHGIESPEERERAGKPPAGASSCAPSSAAASSRSPSPTTAAGCPRHWSRKAVS